MSDQMLSQTQPASSNQTTPQAPISTTTSNNAAVSASTLTTSTPTSISTASAPTPAASVSTSAPVASTTIKPPTSGDALSVLEAAIAQASQQSDAARLAAEKTMRQAAEETGELAQVLPSAILSATNTLNPTTAATTAKEAEGLRSPDKSNQAEAGTGIQAVEIEKNPELPPEVEGFINKVEQQADQLPKEIVIADAIKNLPQHHPLPKQPVVILPITPEIEKTGATKSPKFSVRWLVEWSRRIMKMFVGKVIYRQS